MPIYNDSCPIYFPKKVDFIPKFFNIVPLFGSKSVMILAEFWNKWCSLYELIKVVSQKHLIYLKNYMNGATKIS